MPDDIEKTPLKLPPRAKEREVHPFEQTADYHRERARQHRLLGNEDQAKLHDIAANMIDRRNRLTSPPSK
jgi:hypothetical protein